MLSSEKFDCSASSKKKEQKENIGSIVEASTIDEWNLPFVFDCYSIPMHDIAVYTYSSLNSWDFREFDFHFHLCAMWCGLVWFICLFVQWVSHTRIQHNNSFELWSTLRQTMAKVYCVCARVFAYACVHIMLIANTKSICAIYLWS